MAAGSLAGVGHGVSFFGTQLLLRYRSSPGHIYAEFSKKQQRIDSFSFFCFILVFTFPVQFHDFIFYGVLGLLSHNDRLRTKKNNNCGPPQWWSFFALVHWGLGFWRMGCAWTKQSRHPPPRNPVTTCMTSQFC